MDITGRWTTWGIDEFLTAYPDMAVAPSASGAIELVGDLSFTATAKKVGYIADTYRLRICIPKNFPADPLSVWDLGTRIDQKFHRLHDGSFCLGSPFQLQRISQRARTVKAFVEQALIPYLAGHTHYRATNAMPFDELDHGVRGLLDEYRQLFGTTQDRACIEFLRLLGTKKRIANKRPCPCGGTQRLGRCHGPRINRFRCDATRTWFRKEAERVNGAYHRQLRTT